jgi:hypothetical protein
MTKKNEPIVATYEVKSVGDMWNATINFSNGDSDDLGNFDTEDAAKASAEQWLDEYETLDNDDERFAD